MKIYTENFTIILNKHITNTEIDPYEFRVLCYLLMLADDDGICFPSYNTIAEKIGIGNRFLVFAFYKATKFSLRCTKSRC